MSLEDLGGSALNVIAHMKPLTGPYQHNAIQVRLMRSWIQFFKQYLDQSITRFGDAWECLSHSVTKCGACYAHQHLLEFCNAEPRPLYSDAVRSFDLDDLSSPEKKPRKRANIEILDPEIKEQFAQLAIVLSYDDSEEAPLKDALEFVTSDKTHPVYKQVMGASHVAVLLRDANVWLKLLSGFNKIWSENKGNLE